MIQPLEPTGEFQSPLVPQALGRLRLLNRSTYTMNDLSGWLFSRSLVNGWRAKTLGLSPLPWLESPPPQSRPFHRKSSFLSLDPGVGPGRKTGQGVHD